MISNVALALLASVMTVLSLAASLYADEISERLVEWSESIIGEGSDSIRRYDLSIQLADFRSRAQLTLPATGSGPFPSVLLVPRGNAADLNQTILGLDGRMIKSQNFRVIAEHLSAEGFAVMRYSRRYVSSYSEVDWERFASVRGPDRLQDVRTALAEMRDHPAVDQDRIYVYAASSGSRIVPSLALLEPEIKGLILVGPVVYHFRTQHRPEILRNVVQPYLTSYCTSGEIDLECLTRARCGPCGLVVKELIDLLAVALEEPANQSSLDWDLNDDDRLDVETEFARALDEMARDRSKPYLLKTLMELSASLTTPLLILQGESDAVIAAEMVMSLESQLEASGHPNHTLKLYPGLGHTLGRAATRTEDDLGEIDPEPLKDIVTWLRSILNEEKGR